MHNEELHDELEPKEEGAVGGPQGGEAHAGEAAAEKAVKDYGIVGIRFEPCGKIYCFRSDGLELRRGERVVVESDLGMSIGRVVVEDYTPEDPSKELKPVLRRVSEEDLKKEKENDELKKEAFAFCGERIMARGLAMKLLGTDVTLDRRRIIFFFSAETRIDFRELVKDLAAKFRTRIELRQVGVRDAARIAGGLGICGRELCCRRFLTSFEPISIKMAKKQELALNTSKLSGVCGRLMCCLGYEYDEKLLAERADRAREEKAQEEPPAEVPAEAQEEAVSATAGPPREKPAEEEQKAEAQAEGTRRRRRRRRGRGKHRHEASRREDAGREELEGERPGEAASEQAQPARKPEGEAAPEAGHHKPFRRRHRRRMRGKKRD